MGLGAGTRLGHYEILGLLGEGGMGQVYRARDTKLNRDVALKILPDAFAADPERLSRFQREAQVLASLNHPNIGHIYGLEDSGATHALVLELVPGPTLADRVGAGALPLSDALPIAMQIAEALEAAHAQGVIHRDLKPANVKVRDDGTVKVLDFGLAKALDPLATSGAELMNSPTITSPAMTQRGVILGTAAYMSPEQARGKAVDKRADIWAFGCVLYEMLTGAQTFGGETLTDVLASVVKNEPDLKILPAGTPRLVRSVLRRCLQKDPAKRLHDIADARLELQEAMAEPEDVPVASPAPPPVSESRRAKWVFAAVALVIGAAMGALLFRALQPAEAKPLIRLNVTRPDGGTMGSGSANSDVAISPDGEHIAYTAFGSTGAQLYIRSIHTLDTATATGIVNAVSPFMSPDGRWVGFFDQSNNALKKVLITGGAPVTICQYAGASRGASWGSNDRIIFATSDGASGLLSVPAGGGTPEVLTKPDPSKNEQDHWFPDVLPGGKAVLFSLMPPQGMAGTQIGLLDVASGTWRSLLQGSSPRFVAPGHIVFGVENTLRAVAFDPESGKLEGDPVPVVERVVRKTSAAMSFAVSGGGTLAYISGDPQATIRTLTWIDRNGHEEPIQAPPRAYVYPRLSPDGSRLAVDIRDQENDIWVWDFLQRTLSRVTLDPGLNRGVAWTSDGRRIAFSATRDGKENVYWQAADGSGVAERLTDGPGVQVPVMFTADGAFLIFQEPGAAPFDLDKVDLRVPPGDRRATKLLNAAYNDANGEVSPDGRWIAYESNENGQRNEIYVRPFPDASAGGRSQVSTNGGTRPVWLPKSGRELFYYEPSGLDVGPSAAGRIMAVPVHPGQSFEHGNAEVAVSKFPSPPALQGRHYDVSIDGKRFIAVKPVETDQTPPQLIVVLNWLEELKKLVPAGK